MGKMDSISKAFLSDSFVFADAFNVLFYDGEQVIRPEDLSDLDSKEIFLPSGSSHGGGGKPMEFSRDLLKRMCCKTAGDVRYVILGIEEQTSVDYAMPLRCLLYDALQYDAQTRELHSLNQRKRKKEAGRHFTSRLLPEDRLKPIVTLVVFLSEEPWNGPRSLREMLEPIPDWLGPFVMDYRLNLLCPHEMSLEQIARFKSDLAPVLLAAKYATDNRRFMETVTTNEAFRRITNPTTVHLISQISTFDLLPKNKKEPNMIKNAMKLSEYLFLEGKKAGLAQGIEKGIEQGIEQGIEKGIEQGIEKGIEQGIEKGHKEGAIIGSIAALLSMQLPGEQICQQLEKLYSLTTEQAQQYLESAKNGTIKLPELTT